MIIRDFRSWDDYHKALSEMPGDYNVGGAYANPNGDWSGGCRSIGEALRIAERGWPEGMEYVRQISMPMVSEMAAQATVEAGWGWDVTGVSFDVGEYLTGNPECWIAPVVKEQKPAISIGMHMSTSGMINSDVLKMRGAAVVALTLALQQGGYAVMVYSIDGGTVDDSETIWIRTPLTSQDGGPLDTDRLVFALAHPAASRQLAYGLEVALSGKGFAKEHFLGWAREGGSRALPPEEWKSDLYLHASHWDDRDWTDPKAVAEWVREMYERLAASQTAY